MTALLANQRMLADAQAEKERELELEKSLADKVEA